MFAKIRAFVGAVFSTAHNIWAVVPLGVQGVLILLAFAVYQFALGYNWIMPTTWADLVTLTSAFFAALWVVALPILRDKLWPTIIPWLLRLLGLSMIQETAGITSVPPGGFFEVRTLWVKAPTQAV